MEPQRPSASYQVALGLVSLLMLSLLLDSLAQFWKMHLPTKQLFLLSLGAVVYGWLWWRSRWAGLVLTLLGGTGLVVAARQYAALTAWLTDLGVEAISLFDQLRAGEWGSTFGVTVGIALLALTAMLAGLLIIWEGFGRGSAFWTMVGGLLFYGIQWAWFFDAATTFFIGFISLSLVLWTLGQAGQRDARWLASGRRIGYRSQIATPLLAVMVTTVVGSILPYQFDTLSLGDFGIKIQEAFPVLRQLRGGGVGTFGGRFSLAVTGFAPYLGTLGGPVEIDEQVALHLSPSGNLTETLYLRGATFLTYTGTTWEYGDAPELALPESGELPSQYPSAVLKESLSVTVTPALNFGRTIFTVLEPQRVDGLSSRYEADQEGNLSASRAIPRNSTYTVTARLPRYSTEQIRQMSRPPSNEDLSRYLQTPDDLPERVRALAQGLTSTSWGPYDQALAIEHYLRSMQYDLDTPTTPKGRDFVDFFLFDLGRGYCTYYATAMAVMLRELEIPTRLVEGFAVPASASYTEHANGTRTYPVLNSQAHAWVEAFFPGYGWVTFDPTPRADLPFIARDTPAPASAPTESPAPQTGTPSPGRPMPEDDLMDPGLTEEFGPAGSRAPKPKAPWYLAPLLSLGALGLIIGGYLRRQDRFVTTGTRSLVQEAWEKAGGLLARFDLGRSPHQTPREYALHLGQALPPLQEQALQVAEDYTQARYGPPSGPVNPEAGNRARHFWHQARAAMFDRYGWRAYLWRRLRWGRRRTGTK